MSDPVDQFRERRVSIRAVSTQEASCHFATLEKTACLWAKVRDLSRAGIRLVLEQHFEPGQQSIVEVPSKTPTSSAVPVRVIHVLDQKDGSWLMGCAFARPLTDQEYQALL